MVQSRAGRETIRSGAKILGQKSRRMARRLVPSRPSLYYSFYFGVSRFDIERESGPADPRGDDDDDALLLRPRPADVLALVVIATAFVDLE